MLEMVLEAADPGPLRLTNDGAEDWHILSALGGGRFWRGGLLAVFRNGCCQGAPWVGRANLCVCVL